MLDEVVMKRGAPIDTRVCAVERGTLALQDRPRLRALIERCVRLMPTAVLGKIAKR